MPERRSGSVGLVTVTTPHGEIAVRGALPEESVSPGDALRVQVDRCIAYANQRRVQSIELA